MKVSDIGNIRISKLTPRRKSQRYYIIEPKDNLRNILQDTVLK